MVPESAVRLRGPVPSSHHRPGGAGPIAVLANQLVTVPPRCHRADPRADGADTHCWWLAYARVNQEHGLADKLLAADVPHLLPLARYDRVTPSGKRRSTLAPLFPGYLFVCGDDFDHMNAAHYGRGRLVSLTPVYRAAELVSDLARLMDAIDAGAPLGKAEPLRPGSRVRVASGPWEGTVGTLVREVSGRESLLLTVHAIGQAVRVEVAAWQCEPIDDDPR